MFLCVGAKVTTVEGTIDGCTVVAFTVGDNESVLVGIEVVDFIVTVGSAVGALTVAALGSDVILVSVILKTPLQAPDS